MSNEQSEHEKLAGEVAYWQNAAMGHGPLPAHSTTADAWDKYHAANLSGAQFQQKG